ncbi:MAG: PqqD family protein [bacterium]|jgi:hypothetical protein|nr:PqqD family protein [bacterium]MBK9778041.1 PqqD family protein [bacterium]
MTIQLSAILVPNEKCPVREVGTGLVIMAPAGTATHSLDEVGAFIWRQCDGRHTLAQVVEALIAEYEVEPGQAVGDVQSFLEQLVEADLVRQA